MRLSLIEDELGLVHGRMFAPSLLKATYDMSTLDEFMQWQTDFAEKRHQLTADLPVCPFAKMARIDNKIAYEVRTLTLEGVMACVGEFARRGDLDLLIVIDPRKDGLSWGGTRALALALNYSYLEEAKMNALPMHPKATFSLNGLYTRRAPFPSIQILRNEVADERVFGLEKTDYYKHWTQWHTDETFLGYRKIPQT